MRSQRLKGSKPRAYLLELLADAARQVEGALVHVLDGDDVALEQTDVRVRAPLVAVRLAGFGLGQQAAEAPAQPRRPQYATAPTDLPRTEAWSARRSLGAAFTKYATRLRRLHAGIIPTMLLLTGASLLPDGMSVMSLLSTFHSRQASFCS